MKYTLAILTLVVGLSANALEVGETAPCVVLNHIAADNTESEHCIRERGEHQKFTLVEFFSITCSACAANLPKLRELGASVEHNALTRMVSIDRNEAAVRAFVKKNRQNLPFEIALDTERDAKRAYDVISTPTLFVLDQNESVVFKHEGVLSTQDIQEIQTLIGKDECGGDRQCD